MQSNTPSGSHQVLARKWRPRDFDSLVGQDTVVRALRHALDNQRLHHAYLLTGTRGVGKTTIARILAKALNCEKGVSSRPCGECSACRGVDEGRFPDYLEMDAASNRKVEEMSVVLENAAYLPTVGRYKVFVIDEVHMLSTHAFNAMLKTLEEPPPHVVFVLATTDPQKVPVTVLSRCMQFGLRNVSPTTVAGHLAHVLDAEDIPYEESSLGLIGKAAGGSMRDGLSLLDQAIALGGGEVQQQTVQEMLGTVDEALAPELLTLLAGGDAAAVVAQADALAARNVAHAQILMAMAGELQRIALAQVGQGESHPLADRIDPGDVQVWYQIAIHGVRDLSLAPDAQTGFMMTLLRMLAFRAESLALTPQSVAQLGAVPGAGGAGMSSGGGVAAGGLGSGGRGAGHAAAGQPMLPGAARTAGATDAGAHATGANPAQDGASHAGYGRNGPAGAPHPDHPTGGGAGGDMANDPRARARQMAAAIVARSGDRQGQGAGAGRGGAGQRPAPGGRESHTASRPGMQPAPEEPGRPAPEGQERHAPEAPGRTAPEEQGRSASEERGRPALEEHGRHAPEGQERRSLAERPSPAERPLQAERPAAARPAGEDAARHDPAHTPAREARYFDSSASRQAAGTGTGTAAAGTSARPEPQRQRQSSPEHAASPDGMSFRDHAAPHDGMPFPDEAPRHAPEDRHPARPDASDAPHIATSLDFDNDWPALAARLPVQGAVRQLFAQSELKSLQGTQFQIQVQVRHLADPALVERARELLSAHFGTEVQLQVTVGQVGRQTAAARATEQQARRQAASERAIADDPFVRTLLEEFGATILPDSIKPLDGENQP